MLLLRGLKEGSIYNNNMYMVYVRHFRLIGIVGLIHGIMLENFVDVHKNIVRIFPGI